MAERRATLHIEHAIIDYDTWSAAFGRFADRRRRAGVRQSRVSRPVDDPRYVVVDLDFDDAEQARAFEMFLRDQVWPTPSSSPALAGAPLTKILDVVEEQHSVG